MSITDELREYANRFNNSHDAWSGIGDELTAIADRIDAEHEAKVAEVASGWDYWESTHVELPKDADGEYIHVGDVMEWCDSGDTLEVIGIGDDTLFYIDPEGDRTYAEWTSARNKRHRAPTVEDVLREMLYKAHIYDEREMELLPDLIADYAKRLTLAEEEDA